MSEAIQAVADFIGAGAYYTIIAGSVYAGAILYDHVKHRNDDE